MDWQLQIHQLNDLEKLLEMAKTFLRDQKLEAAATVLDRAYGLRPDDPEIGSQRQQLLDRLSRQREGVTYRYVPAGYFLMGSEQGDPDEKPVHLARTKAFWIAEVPVDWAQFCRVLGYSPPPLGQPAQGDLDMSMYFSLVVNAIRLQYCEDHTHGACDWHNHFYEAVGETGWPYGTGREALPHGYASKPVVAVSYEDADHFCHRSGTRLPSETEWEKAARGGLIGQPYPWGSLPPSSERCDFHRFEEFSILPGRRYPPNGYGLYAMSGGVWEWTSTRYDALAYRGRAGPWLAKKLRLSKHQVVRGGSWADCAEAVTVSFRNSRGPDERANPNQGLRVCLTDP
jgi:formylglycine-generating enzyme required for sulfatase activity